MDRNGKGRIIEEVRATLERSNVAIVSHYRGLTVGEMTDLRRQMRDAGGELRVVKNTLAKRAAQGTSFEPLGDYLTGPAIIATSDDPVGPAKVLSEFAKKHKNLTVLGGVLDGVKVDPDGIDALAKLPPKEVLQAQLLGVMMGPIRGLVTVMAAVPGGFVRALEQIRQQKEGAAA